MLSEQQIVDCSGSWGNHGCAGGWYHNAWKYVKSNRGIDSERSYLYEGYDGQCRFNPRYVLSRS